MGAISSTQASYWAGVAVAGVLIVVWGIVALWLYLRTRVRKVAALPGDYTTSYRMYWMSYGGPGADKRRMHIAFALAGIGIILIFNYFVLAWGQATTVRLDAVTVTWSRWAFYALASILSVYIVFVFNGINLTHLNWVSLIAVIYCVCGVLGTISTAARRYYWTGPGALAFVTLVVALIVLTLVARNAPWDIVRWKHIVLIVFLIVSWVIYPILLILGHAGTGDISLKNESWSYFGIDIFWNLVVIGIYCMILVDPPPLKRTVTTTVTRPLSM